MKPSDPIARRRLRPPFFLAAVLIALAASCFSGNARALTVEEIILLHKTGVSADIIIQNLRKSGKKLRLTPSHIDRLRRAKLPTKVLEYLIRGKVSKQEGPRSERQKAADVFRAMEEKKRAERAALEAEARRREALRLRMEAEKLKIEAQRMAAAAKAAKTRAADVRRTVVTTLRKGFDLLQADRFGKAAMVFHGFIRSGLVPPNSHRYVDGEYGLAKTLYRAGLIQAAIPHLVEALRRGPQTSRFNEAFTLLFKAVGRIDYSHPILALLGTFATDLANRPRRWKSNYHFLMGEFNERYEETEKALVHFQKVHPSSPRYAAAQYHAALLHVRAKRSRTALKAFRTALKAARRLGQRETADLAHLALARLAYEVGSYRAAGHHYRKIPRTSRMFWRAQYERAWSEVMSQKYQAALGTLHGLTAPNLKKEHIPDRFVLEAAVYLNICRYDEAKKALTAFRKSSKPLFQMVSTLLQQHPSATKLYRAVMGIAQKQTGTAGRLRAALMDSVEVYRATATAAQARKELIQVPRMFTGRLLAALRKELGRRTKALTEKAGLTIRRRLNELTGELEALEVKATEIALEVELAEKQILEAETSRLKKGQLNKARALRRRLKKLRIRAGYVTWPFEGEFWLDEIGNFKSRLRSACRPAGAAKK